MKRRIFALTLVLATAFMLVCTSCSSGGGNASTAPSDTSSAAPQQVYTVKMANQVPTTDPIYLGMDYFGQLLKEKSGGRFDYVIYPNSEFGGSNKEQLEMTMDGTLQFTTVPAMNIANMHADLKCFNVNDYPFLLETMDEAYAFWDSDYSWSMLEKLEDTLGVYGLPAYSLGWVNMSTSKNLVKIPSDIAGQKIRTSVSNLYVEALKTLGIAPTPVEWTEIYTALQQGTCDGMTTATGLYITNKFYEVQKYMVYISMLPFNHYPVYNKEWYDALPDDLKAVFDECKMDYLAKVRELEDAYEAEAVKTLEEHGMTVYVPTAEEKALWVEPAKAVWESCADVAGSEVIQAVREILGK